MNEAERQAELAAIRAELAELEVEVCRRERAASYLSGLFPHQRSFVSSKERFRCAVCSRRAGKTHGIGVYLIQGAELAPCSSNLYIAITRPQAKRNIWQKLKDLNRWLNVGLEFKEGDLVAVHPNGSEIWLAGCPDASHIDKFRGPAYKRVAIDEAASFPAYLDDLIIDVLEPALMDWRGELVLIGTPGVAPTGIFWAATTGLDDSILRWPTHHWTMLDNPHIPHARQELEDKLRRRGWSEDHPTHQREDVGRWVTDRSMLVYSGYSNKNLVPVLPEGRWYYTLGVDLGASEEKPSTAFVVWAYSQHDPSAYAVEAWAKAGLTPSDVADEVEQVEQRYKPESIVMDAGGLGGAYVKEIRERRRIPVEAAEKNNKRGYQEMMNGDLKGAKIKVLGEVVDGRVTGPCAGLVGEWKVLPWKNDQRQDERPGVPNHHADAALYSWRRCRAFDAREAPTKPDRNAIEEQKVIASLEKQAGMAEKGRPWWKRVPRR